MLAEVADRQFKNCSAVRDRITIIEIAGEPNP